MKASVSRVVAVAADLLPGLTIALPAAYFTVDSNVRASFATLGRDQGIFQYVAWAVRGGARLYRDVRDVNGPLATLFHIVFQWMGGMDEHRFRVLDLVVNGLAFAFAGACLATLARTVTPARMIGFACAGWVALSSQYVAYGFWDTAQRESFADLFVLVAIGLQLLGQRAMREERPWRGLVAAAAAASVTAWFAKPTFATFTLVAAFALLVDDVPVPRARRLLPFVLGAAGGGALSFAALASIADVGAWVRITFVDVPAMYRFIWPRTIREIVTLPGYDRMTALGIVTCVGLLLLVIAGRVPRRALPVAAMPVCGLASVFAQAKGFPYHFHPVTCGTSLVLVALVVAAWDVAENGSALRKGFATVLALFVGGRAGYLARVNPDPPPPYPGTPVLVRLSHFERVDFFPVDLQEAADYLDATTSPGETVQTYAMDPYLLFLARRMSASPYIYAYDLDVDAAMGGSYWNDAGLVPTPEQRARIAAMRDEHEDDLLRRIAASPPSAFVLVDKSPLMTSEDATMDLAVHCPRTSQWLAEHMEESARFGAVHVWLPSDRMSHAEHPGME